MLRRVALPEPTRHRTARLSAHQCAIVDQASLTFGHVENNEQLKAPGGIKSPQKTDNKIQPERDSGQRMRAIKVFLFLIQGFNLQMGANGNDLWQEFLTRCGVA